MNTTIKPCEHDWFLSKYELVSNVFTCSKCGAKLRHLPNYDGSGKPYTVIYEPASVNHDATATNEIS